MASSLGSVWILYTLRCKQEFNKPPLRLHNVETLPSRACLDQTASKGASRISRRGAGLCPVLTPVQQAEYTLTLPASLSTLRPSRECPGSLHMTLARWVRRHCPWHQARASSGPQLALRCTASSSVSFVASSTHHAQKLCQVLTSGGKAGVWDLCQWQKEERVN